MPELYALAYSGRNDAWSISRNPGFLANSASLLDSSKACNATPDLANRIFSESAKPILKGARDWYRTPFCSHRGRILGAPNVPGFSYEIPTEATVCSCKPEVHVLSCQRSSALPLRNGGRTATTKGIMLPTDDVTKAFSGVVDAAPRIATLAQFDDAVKRYGDAWEERNHIRPKLWFRGHANLHWFLAPPALRDQERQLAYKYETHTFIEFKRRAIGLVDPSPRTNWGWLYVAQHNGLPTRLLDWTEGSHVALFFALRQGTCEGVLRPKDPCVWMLNPGQLNKMCWGFSNVVTVDDQDEQASVLLNPYIHARAPEASGAPAQPLAIIPEYVSPRLHAQRGAFVAFADDETALVRKIQEDSNEHADAPLAKPILINKDFADNLERELDIAGVAESTVFPDVGGLCAELARRHDRGRL